MRIIKNIGAFGLAFGLTFLLLEGYMQLAEVEPVSVSDFDPEVGRIMMPDRSFAYYNENFVVGRYNKYGYLGPAYPQQASDSIFRIALLGDSYVEGFQVQERNHFRSLLEEKLQDHLPDQDIQVLNFGRSGFDLANSHAYYYSFVSDYDPDLTLYFLSVSDLEQSKDDPLLPYWYLEDGKLRLSDDFRESNSLKTFQMVKHGLHYSSILQMINNDLKLVKSGEAPRIIFGKLAEWGQPTPNNAFHPAPPNIDKVTFALIQDIGQNPGAVIVNRDSIPFPGEVQRAIRQAGIPLITVVDTLEDLRESGIDPVAWEATGTRGHWNYPGHRAVSSYLSRRLLPLIQPNTVSQR